MAASYLPGQYAGFTVPRTLWQRQTQSPSRVWVERQDLAPMATAISVTLFSNRAIQVTWSPSWKIPLVRETAAYIAPQTRWRPTQQQSPLPKLFLSLLASTANWISTKWERW